MSGALKVLTAPGVWTTIGGGSFATEAETVAGVLDDRAVTPAGLEAALDAAFPYISVKDRGAIGDGTTNDSAAIQAALDAAGGGTVLFPPGNYNLGTTGVVAHSSIKMMPGARLTYSGTDIALMLDSTHSCVLDIHVRKTAYSWHTGADTSSIGLRIRNSNFVRVRAEIWNFWVGLDLHGDQLGTSYGVIDCITFNDNMKSVRFSKIGTGWANQHELRGQVRINSGPPVGYPGTRYIDLSTAGNNNTFINMTFENNMPEYVAEILSSYNMFVNCRFESSAPMRFLGTGCHSNYILGGYNVSGGPGGTPPAGQFVVSTELANTPLPTIVAGFGQTFSTSNSGNRLGMMIREMSTVANPVLTVQAPNVINDAIRLQILGGGSILTYAGQGKGVSTLPEAVFHLDSINRRFYVNDGTVASPTTYIAPTATTADLNGAWRAVSTFYANAVSPTPALQYGSNAADPRVFKGTGSPEGVVAASPGAQFIRTDGGAGNALYIKEAGSGTMTNWFKPLTTAAATTKPTVAAAATDPATTMTLVNSLRTALINLGLVS